MASAMLKAQNALGVLARRADDAVVAGRIRAARSWEGWSEALRKAVASGDESRINTILEDVWSTSPGYPSSMKLVS